MPARDIYAPLRAAEALQHLSAGEYRLALSRMAEYMRCCVSDPELTDEETHAARAVLHQLEQRLT